MRKTILASAVAAAVISTGTAPALAAPAEPELIRLLCDGEVVEVLVKGNGDFTPGHLVGSTGVLVPIAFGDFTFTAVRPDGTTVSGSEPGPDAKGGGNVARRNPRAQVTCTFGDTFTLPEADPELGLPAGTVVTFGGSVTGFLTGRR